MAFGKNNKVNYQGLVKKKKLPKKEPEEEKFSHTLTTTREESAEESNEDKTPTNVSPPLILPKKKNDLPTLMEKKKTIGKTLQVPLSRYLQVSCLPSSLQSSNKWRHKEAQVSQNTTQGFAQGRTSTLQRAIHDYTRRHASYEEAHIST